MGGHQSHDKGLDGVIKRVQSRAGTITISGRYHKLPKKFEDDYSRTATVLGTGYNGQVFLATNKSNKAKVAVKPFPLHGVGKEKREELELETEVFLAMDHPHVARLVDVYENEQQLQLVMECMSGGELFKHVVEKKRLSEKEAAEAVHQMLLSLMYIHSQGVVHRDIKLENFMYETEKKTHLKLIDFGFSKLWAPNTQMQLSCGTLAYVAPEVLKKNYGSQCDMWSFGVTVFIMLFGYMPFSGSEETTMAKIKDGRYNVKKDVWAKVGQKGQDFVKQLLLVDPKARLTADKALAHPFVSDRETHSSAADATVDADIVSALVNFRQGNAFRRACMNMMAWSLTVEERAKVREEFLKMDKDNTGTIKLWEFKKVLEEQFNFSDAEVLETFKALDSNNDDEIHYSDFLAANLSRRLQMHDDLLHQTFSRFDTDSSGFITKANLKEVLGPGFDEQQINDIIADADKANDGQISYQEWIAYLKGGEANSKHTEIAARVVDRECEKNGRDQNMTKKGGGSTPSGSSSQAKKSTSCCAIS